MKTTDAAKIAAAWSTGLGGARQAYIDGVNAYGGNPGEVAKTRKGQMMANWNASMADGGRWDTNVVAGGRIWKNNAVTVGANNLTTGATKGSPKVQRYFAAAIPVYQQLQSDVRAIADPKARMNAWFDGAQQRLKGLGKS